MKYPCEKVYSIRKERSRDWTVREGRFGFSHTEIVGEEDTKRRAVAVLRRLAAAAREACFEEQIRGRGR